MTSNQLEIAVMPGDGIGVEVIDAALSVLDVVERRHGIGCRRKVIAGGARHYQETGTALSEAGLQQASEADAILFGAMGWPDVRYPDGTEIAPQLDLRLTLDLYAGVRPIRAIPGVPRVLSSPESDRIDFVILRESTEGAFVSRGKGVVENDNIARDQILISRMPTERLSRFAFTLAKGRAIQRNRRPRVTLVDKANVFRSFAFMRKVFFEVAAHFPDVEANAQYVDSVALDLVRRPWEFDVLPMENLFGDILSDLGAGLIGGMGFAPSADIGDAHAVFQPSHGSAPDIAGRGIANPTATILSLAMMLEWLGNRHDIIAFRDAASEIEAAVDSAFGSGAVRSFDIGGSDGTGAVARAIIDEIGNRSRTASITYIRR